MVMKTDQEAGLPANDDNFDMRTLARVAIWGAAAMLALLIAVFATRSDSGTRRMAMAFGTVTGSTPAARTTPTPSLAGRETDLEIRRLTDAMRSLSSDRDRLLARVTVLERNFDDMTGSIGRNAPSAPKSESPASLPLVGPSVSSTISAPLQIAPGERAGATQAQPGETPASTGATRTDFGIDIGGGANLAALRVAWNTARANHPAMLENLRAVAAIRDGSKPGSVELRLIVGPLSNAAAAARLCASLAAAGLSCQPAVFEGQRLAQR
jgi:hypothetical protein